MSMFKETAEGQTHSYNDGCGMPDHNREEGVYYDESFPNDCCEKCHDVTFEKTYPADTAYHACLNLKCKCHKKPSHIVEKEIEWKKNIGDQFPFIEPTIVEKDWKEKLKNANMTGGTIFEQSAYIRGFDDGKNEMRLKNAGLYRQLFGETGDRTFTSKELWELFNAYWPLFTPEQLKDIKNAVTDPFKK